MHGQHNIKTSVPCVCFKWYVMIQPRCVSDIWGSRSGITEPSSLLASQETRTFNLYEYYWFCITETLTQAINLKQDM